MSANNAVNFPVSPWLDLAFYYADARTAEQKLKDFVITAIRLGTQIVAAEDQSRQTLIMMDSSISLSKIMDLDNPSRFYVQTPMQISTPGHNELIEYMYIPPDIQNLDTPPIGIVTEAGFFHENDSLLNNNDSIDASSNRVVDFFLQMAEETKPAYAALLVGEFLETPAQLRLEPGSVAFQDFYISRSYIGDSNLEKILHIYDGSYLRSLTDGVYISTGSIFNPTHIRLPLLQNSLQRWEQVAKIIAARVDD